jgi:hypothetical protein
VRSCLLGKDDLWKLSNEKGAVVSRLDVMEIECRGLERVGAKGRDKDRLHAVPRFAQNESVVVAGVPGQGVVHHRLRANRCRSVEQARAIDHGLVANHNTAFDAMEHRLRHRDVLIINPCEARGIFRLSEDPCRTAHLADARRAGEANDGIAGHPNGNPHNWPAFESAELRLRCDGLTQSLDLNGI